MEPWQSWTVLLVGGGAAWYYYNARNRSKDRARRTDAAAKRTDPHSASQRDGKGRQVRVGSDGSQRHSGSDPQEARHVKSSSPLRSGDPDKPRKRKDGKAKGTKSALGSAVETTENVKSGGDLVSEDDAAEEDISNQEFAKQLSGLKKGTSLTPAASSNARPKTLKQSRTNGSTSHLSVAEVTDPSANTRDVSATSSTTGADADDDLSPAVSPALTAATTNPTSASGDVSDMLEAPSPGPSVLRLTESSQPAAVQKPRPQKSMPPAETKKQRQNRKKAEEKKLAREEAERERRVLLEKQLRASREAEGRPARNGVAVASKPPASSAWGDSTKPSTGVSRPQPPTVLANGAPLLDTFDQEESVGQTRNDASPAITKNGNSSFNRREDSGEIWDPDLPSEEDQMRMINEMDDQAGWNTVPKGKKSKKKGGDVSESTSGKPSSELDRKDERNAPALFSGKAFANAGDSDWAVV
ncbi:MAG: hypothetical protein M1837_004961 [Sclerophora amabilis]|nr:MAG: hypothetical protein M1837_004961 [Sclerophora amabilis]